MSVHPTATVDDGAVVGEDCRIWHHAHIRSGATLGRECIVGKNVYIGAGVTLGDRCKVQNNALVYEGAALADGVFIGPGAIIANDRRPRAILPGGSIKSDKDWDLARATIGVGAAVGAGAIIVPPVTVGAWSMVAAGAVVTKDVQPHALVAGNPARQIGWVCMCGHRSAPNAACSQCGRVFEEVV